MDSAATANGRLEGAWLGDAPLRPLIAQREDRPAEVGRAPVGRDHGSAMGDPAPMLGQEPPAASCGQRLRWHLLVFAAALLSPVLAFGLWMAIEYGGSQRARLEGEARAVVRELQAGVDRELSTLLAAAQTLAASPALKARDLPAFERQAAEIAAARGVVVVLRAPSGRQLVNTVVPLGTPLPARSAEGENPDATRTVAAGVPFVSDLFLGAVVGRSLLRVVVPARFPDDDEDAAEDFGQIDIAFAPERLRRVLADAGLPSGWMASVVDRAGVIIARSHRHEEFLGTPATPDFRENTGGRGGTWRGTTVEGDPVFGAYARIHHGDWRVAVGVPVSVIEEPLWRSFWLVAGAGAALTGIAASLALALARRVEASVGALAAAAAGLGAGRDVVFPATPVAEVNAVGAALVAAAAELRARAVAEQAAREEAQRGRELLQAVIDGTSDPILACDLHGRFVLVNRAGASLLGVSLPAAALGRRLCDLLPARWSGSALACGRAVVAEGRAQVVEDCIEGGGDGAGSDPARRVLVTTKSPWRDAEGRIAGVVCVSRDETARRAAEERLDGLRAELLRAARLGAVGAMAAGLAHELNQPLGAATNFLAAAEAMLGPAGAESPGLDGAREAVAEAGRQTLRAGEIVRRLRDFVSNGDADMRVEEVGPLVAEACAAALPPSASGEAAVALTLDVAAETCAALVDRVQVQQVVINLVRNAAEALRGAGEAAEAPPAAGSSRRRRRREITVSVRRPAGEEGGGCEVSVADNGPGIAPEARERLFEPFSSTKPRGMGIGLAICRAVVEAHGGRLWAEPGPGGGAVFRFALPPPLTPTGRNEDDEIA